MTKSYTNKQSNKKVPYSQEITMIHQNKSVIISLISGLFILSNEVKLTLGFFFPSHSGTSVLE